MDTFLDTLGKCLTLSYTDERMCRYTTADFEVVETDPTMLNMLRPIDTHTGLRLEGNLGITLILTTDKLNDDGYLEASLIDFANDKREIVYLLPDSYYRILRAGEVAEPKYADDAED